MSPDQMQALVRECGLDWQRGYVPLFDGDPTNRYAILIEAAQRGSDDMGAALRKELQIAVRECCNQYWYDGHYERVKRLYGINTEAGEQT